VQIVDYSETNLSAQLARIHEQIANVIAMLVAAKQNSGLELEAVVQASEKAANQVMEAAEAIGGWLQAGCDRAAFQTVTQQVNAILEMCMFQNPTGQRVRPAIEHLQHVEAMRSNVKQHAPEADSGADAHTQAAHGLARSEVDQLFGCASRYDGYPRGSSPRVNPS
jgi:type II secretory pathway component PulM